MIVSHAEVFCKEVPLFDPELPLISIQVVVYRWEVAACLYVLLSMNAFLRPRRGGIWVHPTGLHKCEFPQETQVCFQNKRLSGGIKITDEYSKDESSWVSEVNNALRDGKVRNTLQWAWRLLGVSLRCWSSSLPRMESVLPEGTSARSC